MKPILFNTEMVRAILDGRKTVTRRVAFKADEFREFPCASYPDGWWFRGRVYASWRKAMGSVGGVMSLCKYRTGDILWVRETWAKDPFRDGYIYPTEIPGAGQKWRPSIHMPREAARIFLRVTDVRVERLKEITFRDIGREGVKWWEDSCEKWVKTWNSTIKPADQHTYGWDANPWVWVIEFDRISKEDAS